MTSKNLQMEQNNFIDNFVEPTIETLIDIG